MKTLRARRIVDVPLEEVSGVCLRRDAGGKLTLVAVGDRANTAAWARLPRRDSGAIDWNIYDIGRVQGSRLPRRHPQIEAVCADGKGHVLFLQESPARVELIDPIAARVLASVELKIQGRGELAESGSDPRGARGEGAVFLPGGHLLVAKEKNPPALIEFGPPGARSRGLLEGKALAPGRPWRIGAGHHRYVALAVWWPARKLARRCADFSDLEIGPDGRLYLLSDQSATIARLQELPPGGGKARLEEAWLLKGVMGKPEGLAFTARGRAIVALDTRKARHNLAILDPPIAPA
jgi:hypothetical protein